MFVNPFWLGILLTLVGFVIVIIVLAIAASHKEAREAEDDGTVMSEEEFRDMIRAAVREAAEEALRNRMYGKGIDDGKEE